MGARPRLHQPATWHPAIAALELTSGSGAEVGAVRKLTLGDGGIVVERLLALDADAADEERLTDLFANAVFGSGIEALREHFASDS